MEVGLAQTGNKNDCNSLCRRCLRSCRQPAAIRLIDCPRFLPFPFKVSKHRFDQLELFAPQSES